MITMEPIHLPKASQRRSKMLSEASSTGTRSTSYQSALLANMQLLSLLDDEAEASIPPPDADSLELRLGRMLSVGSVISITSSIAEEQDAGAKTGVEAAPYKLIGWGACGAVYTQDGSTKVLKLAKTDDEQLWIDLSYDDQSMGSLRAHARGL